MWRVSKRVRLARFKLEAEVERSVLYLRSFADDSKAASGVADWLFNPCTMRTIEENTVSHFRRIGQVVAVGCPEDELPPLGAIRMYVGDNEDWKDTVLNCMQEARLIVVHLAESEGLGWEIRTATKLWSEKLLLIFPIYSWRRNSSRAARYDLIRKQLLADSGVLLPEYSSSSFCIGFSKGLQPITAYPSKMDAIQCMLSFGGELSRLIERFVDEYVEGTGTVEDALKCIGTNQQKSALSPGKGASSWFEVQSLFKRMSGVALVLLITSSTSLVLTSNVTAISMFPFVAAICGGVLGLVSPAKDIYRHKQHQICFGLLLGFLSGLVLAVSLAAILFRH